MFVVFLFFFFFFFKTSNRSSDIRFRRSHPGLNNSPILSEICENSITIETPARGFFHREEEEEEEEREREREEFVRASKYK